MKKMKLLLFALAGAVVFASNIGAAKASAATGTPISTAEEFLAMENNPSGSYYLTNDIELPENTNLFSRENLFTGTLDGKGHKIKGYKFTGTGWCEAGIIRRAKGAAFKNITLENVDINIQAGANGTYCGALVAVGIESNSYSNIKVSGNITVTSSGAESSVIVGGIVGTDIANMEKCSNSAKITVKAENKYSGVRVGGLAGNALGETFKKCSNSGDVSVEGFCGSGDAFAAAGVAADQVKNLISCKNTGDITVTVLASDNSPGSVNAAGIAPSSEVKVQKCTNTGKIKVVADTSCRKVYMAGIINDISHKDGVVSKCWNKGAISISGKVGGGSYDGVYAGGLCSDSVKTVECWNKAKISVNLTEGFANVGGVCGIAYNMKNCYNIGAVSLNGDGNVGGLAGSADAGLVSGKVICNYNTGKVVGKGKANKGIIAGTYSGSDMIQKRTVYNNYYKGSGKPYGITGISWKDWVAKATKVSSITSGSCPKLSSKYWTYSSKAKRLILKNNKEK